MGIDKFNPPESALVTVWGWSHDANGNPVARYEILWPGGSFASPRREQVGYRDKVSESALWRLTQLFPGTAWKIGPDGIKGSREAGEAVFRAVRDRDAEFVPVIFRLEKAPGCKPTPIAFFPTLPADSAGLDVVCYAHLGQHSGASKAYYRTTRRARPSEYAELRHELESIGYRLEVCQRWTPAHDARRRAELRRQNVAANRAAEKEGADA